MAVKCVVLSLILGLCISSRAQQCTPLQVTTGPYSTQPPSYAAKTHPFQPSIYWGSLSAPYPTNSFFTNVILNGSDQFPIVPTPYHTLVTGNGLQVSSPARVASEAFIMEVFVPDIEIDSVESTSRTVSAYDELSVTLDWAQNGASGLMRCPLVRGSPFITMQYTALTPIIRTIHAILSINGDGTQNRQVTGTEFVIYMNNGQTWKLYSLGNTSITLQWQGVSQMVALSPFTGTLRLALVQQTQDLTALDASVEIYPIGGAVNYSYSSCSDGSTVADIQFNWATAGGQPSNLLMLALPHHLDSMVSPTTTMQGSYRCMKGNMTGIIGNTWNLKETLASISWTAPREIDPAMKPAIVAALQNDKTKRAGNYATYWAGKELAAMGRLALIADELGDTNTSSLIRQNLKADIDVWLLVENPDPLVYDSTWGGICSYPGMQNVNVDFGQGYYNDHHFHYGYFAYAAAALGKGDTQWLASRKQQIIDLVRDYANPSKQDPYFPVTRHKDWYDGHSWAAGLFGFGDSKDQESSSEAVNSYYGLYLLGEALGDQSMSLFGRLLLATEIRSVQKYWHIKTDSDIYEPVFAANTMAGVVWSSKVDYATFFGDLPEYIHGIQMMPFTPITEQLLNTDWLVEERQVIDPVLNRTDPPISDDWKAFVLLSQSILDKQSAWSSVQQLQYFDDGNTMTNSLYFVATR